MGASGLNPGWECWFCWSFGSWRGGRGGEERNIAADVNEKMGHPPCCSDTWMEDAPWIRVLKVS